MLDDEIIMNNKKCQSISKTTQKQCENNALKGCAYCWVHYPKKESVQYFVLGIFLTFFIQITIDFFTVSPEEKEMQNLQSQTLLSTKQNAELIKGKNELLKANEQLKESIGIYQIENTNLKNQVDSLKKRTENIDTISKDKTRIGDLVLSRNGSTIHVTSVDNIVLERINNARKVAKDGNVDKAISIIEDAEKAYPNHIPEGAKILKAKYIFKKGNYNLALSILEEMDEKTISPENAQIYFELRSFCYIRLGDYASAMNFLKLTIENNRHVEITSRAKHNLEIIERKLTAR